jgi:hypothetical protein
MKADQKDSTTDSLLDASLAEQMADMKEWMLDC